MTETTARIRWEAALDGEQIGYVGTLSLPAFRLWPPQDGERILLAYLAGSAQHMYHDDADDPEGALKARAEELLAEFVTSLGAQFPAEPLDDDQHWQRGEARDMGYLVVDGAAPPVKRPVLTSRYVFGVLCDAGFTPWGTSGEPGFTTGWYMDAMTVDHVGADLPVHGPLEGPRAIIADYAQTLFAAGFDTHVTVNTVLVRKRSAANPAPAGEKE